jgi:hypothetical protein
MPKEQHLIHAVERGGLKEMRAALEDGADPNAQNCL